MWLRRVHQREAGWGRPHRVTLRVRANPGGPASRCVTRGAASFGCSEGSPPESGRVSAPGWDWRQPGRATQIYPSLEPPNARALAASQLVDQVAQARLRGRNHVHLATRPLRVARGVADLV